METFEHWALNNYGLTEWSLASDWVKARQCWDLLDSRYVDYSGAPDKQ